MSVVLLKFTFTILRGISMMLASRVNAADVVKLFEILSFIEGNFRLAFSA